MFLFITGATGFVGREVVRKAREARHSVRVLARNSKSKVVEELSSGARTEIWPGDVTDGESLRGALEGIEAVVHLVGIISEAGRRTFENIHLRGTENMVNAARAAGVKRFVQMSALGTRPNPVSRYHQTKWAAEELVRRSGLEFTIFRPSLIFGPRDKFVNLFARMSRFSPVLPLMGSGKAKFQPVAVETVAEAFVRSLDGLRSVGQTYDLCGPDTLTLPEILDTILSVTGRRRWKVRVPIGVARFQAAVLEFFCARLLGKAPPLNRDQLIMLEEGNVGNAQPANELFGLRAVGFREGISRYLVGKGG